MLIKNVSEYSANTQSSHVLYRKNVILNLILYMFNLLIIGYGNSHSSYIHLMSTAVSFTLHQRRGKKWNKLKEKMMMMM